MSVAQQSFKSFSQNIKHFDIEKIDKQTINSLTHIINNTFEDTKINLELVELLQCKKETAKEYLKEIYLFTWFYPGFQLYVINAIYTFHNEEYLSENGSIENYKVNLFIIENIFKILSLLCEEYIVCEDILRGKIDTLLHPFLLGPFTIYSEKIKLQALEVYCSVFRTLNCTKCDCLVFSEIFPIVLKVINFQETRLKVKGTYLMFLIISLQLYVDDFTLVNKGLEYSVQTIDRFNAIDMVISPLVGHGISSRNPLLLKNVFRIYLQLCEKQNVKIKIFEDSMPEAMFSKELSTILKNDYELNELYKKVVKVFDDFE